MPLWVGLAVSTGFGLFGAKKQSDAANKASKQQVASIDQAKADLRPLYESNVARLDPYAQLGAQGVGQLRALGGYPTPPALPTGGSAAQPDVAIPLNPNNPANFGTTTPPMNMSDPRVQELARGGSLATLGGGGSSAYRSPASGQPQMSQPPQGQGGSFAAPGGGLVTLRAPTGEVGEFPAEQAAYFIQRGAQRV